jgi:hypothetical protein
MRRLTEAALSNPPKKPQGSNLSSVAGVYLVEDPVGLRRQAVELVDAHWREQWSGKAQDSKEERAS